MLKMKTEKEADKEEVWSRQRVLAMLPGSETTAASAAAAAVELFWDMVGEEDRLRR